MESQVINGVDLSSNEQGWDSAAPDTDLDTEETSDATEEVGKIAVNIKISPNIEVSLCRRGRRRFRELQVNNPDAKIRFDRRRKILRVVGTDAVIEVVRRQLESLGGLHKPVPYPVWCELMRTRTEEDASRSLLLHLQEQSGCRIHIERALQEVRIFGPDENSALAEKLVEELCEMCVEEKVAVKDSTCPSPSTLQCISETCEVTIKAHRGHLMVYGRRQAVADAVEELQHEYVDSGYVDTDDEFGMTWASSATLSDPTASRASDPTASRASVEDHPTLEGPSFKRTSSMTSQGSQPLQAFAFNRTSSMTSQGGQSPSLTPVTTVIQVAPRQATALQCVSSPPSPQLRATVPSNEQASQALPMGTYVRMMPGARPILVQAQPILMPGFSTGAPDSGSGSPCSAR
mmetsp:Transcript_7883/g.18429  ORF Transcript_7883/g.18429 Transcript_7883/m.18429 type:complete len:404 (+) Transcript_7883:71-1282(+)